MPDVSPSDYVPSRLRPLTSMHYFSLRPATHMHYFSCMLPLLGNVTES